MKNNKTPKPVTLLIIMLLSMVSGSICMNKMSPVLSFVAGELDLATSQSGLLISIFTLSGIFLSMPMGVLTTKYGVFKTGLFSLAAIIAGSCMGALARSYAVLLVSRFIEGVGLMFLVTLGPSAVGAAFPEKNRGAAMGLLMCFMAFGQIIALNIAPVVAQALSWRYFWWMSAAFALIAMVLWIVFIRGMDAKESQGSREKTGIGAAARDVLTNKGVWLTAFTFFAFMLAHMGVFSYMPSYMSEVGGLNASTAGSLTSIASFVGIPVGILGGVLADKWGSRKKPLMLSLILLSLLLICIPFFNGTTYAVLMFLYGLLAMEQAGYCMSAASEVVEKNQTGFSTGVVNTGQWAGAFLGSALFGILLESLGWNASFYVCAAAAALGALATALNTKLK